MMMKLMTMLIISLVVPCTTRGADDVATAIMRRKLRAEPKIFDGFFSGRLQCWLFGICNRPGSCCTNRNRGYDASGNPYGSLKGNISGPFANDFPSEINYTSKGMVSNYSIFCGHIIPFKPTRIGRGVFEWREAGNETTCDANNASLTRVDKRSKQWMYNSTEDIGSKYDGIMNHTCLPCNLL